MRAAGWGHVQQAVKYDNWATSRRQDSPQQRWTKLAANDWQQRQNASIAAAQAKCGPAAGSCPSPLAVLAGSPSC